MAAKLIKEAGFPPGVVNVISGFGNIAGAAIALHMQIDKVSFTGSTVTGRSVMRAAANSNLKKVTLELGGKNPNIVFNDADIDDAISRVNFGIYYTSGQVCCAGSSICVQEGIYDKFVEKLRARAIKNVVGDPFESDTFQGPQVSRLQFDRIMKYVHIALCSVLPILIRFTVTSALVSKKARRSRLAASEQATRAILSSPPSSPMSTKI